MMIILILLIMIKSIVVVIRIIKIVMMDYIQIEHQINHLLVVLIIQKIQVKSIYIYVYIL